MLTADSLQQYWSGSFLEANVLIGLNLLGALVLGMLVGYERSYHGRAAGMRTYGLVCMASTALTVFVGYHAFWYGGEPAGQRFFPDPTRVVQGIVTGVGFLCAGVIMRDGMSIRGLTTAASIWAASTIGVLLGVGFYGAALLLALLCALSMSLLTKLENRLPSRRVMGITLTFREGFAPKEERLVDAALHRGYRFLRDSLSITLEQGHVTWRFGVLALDRANMMTPASLSQELTSLEGVVGFSITPSRN